VSNALGRLRRHFGDELFLRTSTGREPTPFAARLAEPVAYALGTLQSAINLRTSFDPAAAMMNTRRRRLLTYSTRHMSNTRPARAPADGSANCATACSKSAPAA